jgi:hypothetical protein
MENDGPVKRVRLFVNGKQRGNRTGLSYSAPIDAPLLIGVSNRESNPALPVTAAYPVISKVQEVVLHNKALSPEEIENHFGINYWP